MSVPNVQKYFDNNGYVSDNDNNSDISPSRDSLSNIPHEAYYPYLAYRANQNSFQNNHHRFQHQQAQTAQQGYNTGNPYSASQTKYPRTDHMKPQPLGLIHHNGYGPNGDLYFIQMPQDPMPHVPSDGDKYNFNFYEDSTEV